MKIGVLTSSRADFGIYTPLLERLNRDSFFDLTIIAFGTHGSPHHGYTVTEIQDSGYKNIDVINSLLVNDDAAGIASSYGLTVIKFSDYWNQNSFDLVICLGDRFEMSAAVQAGIPFGVKFAHLHGGETTLGAIDDVFRHQITLASDIHFASTEVYRDKIVALTGKIDLVYNVGSLSLDRIEDFKFEDEAKFKNKYNIPDHPYLLITFHPETILPQRNRLNAEKIKEALVELSKDYFLIVTMPNADTDGNLFRDAYQELQPALFEKMKTIENFGKNGYFNAMKYAELIVGNSSSGILEAATFGKYVVNVGDRQKGRARSENVIDCTFKADEITESVRKAAKYGAYSGTNIYKKEKTADNIIEVLMKYYETL
ncbi:MAG: UDP-N-acetylglucosamine 2-epimerase [Candidatus Paceibacterota bacterium]